MNDVALVTGASGGIGRAICAALAEAGFDVGVHYNANKDGALAAAEEVEKAGARFALLKADLRSAKGCQALVEECQSALGGVYALVNNAGATDDGLLLRMSDGQYDAVIKANLDSCFYCTRAAAALMLKKKRGRIINITSVVGLTGNAGQANYAAAKAGIIGLTKSCAKELGGRNICVNAVAPGFIVSAMSDKLSDEIKEKYKQEIPLKRFGRPQDVADLVCFLAGNKASYITGQVLVVDGGMIL